MLKTITRLDKMAALTRALNQRGLLEGTTSMAMALAKQRELDASRQLDQEESTSGSEGSESSDGEEEHIEEVEEELDDVGPCSGPRLASSLTLAVTRGEYLVNGRCTSHDRRDLTSDLIEPKYPRSLDALADYIDEPAFKDAFLEYLFQIRHPKRPIPADIQRYTPFNSKIYVHHSATARFYAPSDACGVGGMQRQLIRCNPDWRGHPRRDTVFVAESKTPVMPHGMMIAQLRLLFSFTDPFTRESYPCALVNWFPTVGDSPDPVTGMWMVEREIENGCSPVQVIDVRSIVRGAHLLPVFGSGRLPEGFSFTTALDAFETYFINPYIDHHTHDMLAQS